MAKPNENQNKSAAVEPTVSVKPQHSSSGLWLGVVILVVILGLAGAGFLLLQQLRDKQQDLGGEMDKDEIKFLEMSKQINTFQSQLAAAQSQIATLQAEMSGKETHYDKKLADFSQLHHDRLDGTRTLLEEAVEKIQRQLGKTRGDWLLADAEYLLSVANRRLHLMGDVNTTKEALIAADHRLRESGDAAAFKIRTQIAKEITAVKKIQLPDIIGIYAVLELLEDNVEKLALFLPYAGKEVTETDHQQEVDNEQHEHEGLDYALIELKGVLTIRHTEQPVKSIITAEQAHFIRDQLRVKLEMVKISMVQQNDRLYQATLTDAQQWVKNNFTQNKDADSYLTELQKLTEIEIHSQFPDISNSLKMLRDITKLRIETDKALQKTGSKKQIKKTVKMEVQKTPSPVAEDMKSPEQIKPETPQQSKAE